MGTALRFLESRQARLQALTAKSPQLRAQLASELRASWQPIHIASTVWRVLRLPPVWALLWRGLRHLAHRNKSTELRVRS